MIVNILREHFLTDSSLAQNKDRLRRGRSKPGPLERGNRSRRSGNDFGFKTKQAANLIDVEPTVSQKARRHGDVVNALFGEVSKIQLSQFGVHFARENDYWEAWKFDRRPAAYKLAKIVVVGIAARFPILIDGAGVESHVEQQKCPCIRPGGRNCLSHDGKIIDQRGPNFALT